MAEERAAAEAALALAKSDMEKLQKDMNRVAESKDAESKEKVGSWGCVSYESSYGGYIGVGGG